MRKMIAAALTAAGILALCACPVSADTSGNWEYEFTDEGLVITAYTGAEEDVAIPDEIGGYRVSVIGKGAFENNTDMRSVVIPEGVSSIKANAFHGCAGLGFVEFNARNCACPDVWIYDGEKGVGVFSGAGSASPDGLAVVFGPEVTKVPDGLFDTASLENTEGLDVYGHNGYPHAAVTYVEFSDSVKEIGARAFRNCRDLRSVIFGEKVQIIGESAFFYCTSLEGIGFNDRLTEIGDRAFRGSSGLTEISWGGNLDTIGKEAFMDCTSLETAELPNPLAAVGERSFRNCIALQKLVLPESLTSLGAESFAGCVKLREIEFNSKNCSVPAVWIYADDRGSGVFSGAGSASPAGMKVVFGPGVSEIPAGMFDTASLEKADGVDPYGRSGYPFAYLTSVEMSADVRKVGDAAFRNCQTLQEVVFGEGLTIIGESAFYGCTALEELIFDDALTEIGKDAFRGDTELGEITWGQGLDTIGEAAFRDCRSLEKAELPDPLTTVGERAFLSCIGLKSVVLPENLTYIGGEAFCGCVKIAGLTIKSANLTAPGVWSYDSGKGVGVFSDAGSSSPEGFSVVFEPTVERIPAYLFDTASTGEYGQTGYPYAYIRSVEIPESVTEVGDAAFRSCQNLEKVVFEGPDAEFGENVFAGCTASSFHLEGPSGGKVWQYAADNDLPYTETVNIQPPETENAVESGEEPAAEPEEAPEAPAQQPGEWVCENGHGGNTGNFCTECGAAKPEPASWYCPECGTRNEGNFCSNCGTPRPER